MRYRLAAICLFALAWPPSAALPCGQEADGIAPIFRGDERLSARVTLSEKNRPLSEVVSGLALKVGVSLTTTRDTRDDRATLFVRERPAAGILTLVSEQFDFEWVRRADGYELRQSEAGKRREQARRAADVAAQLANIRKRMALISRLAARGYARPDRRAARERELDEMARDPTRSPEEKVQIAEEKAALADLSEPGAIVAAVFTSLGPIEGARLRSRGELQLSTADATLPDPLAEQVHAAVGENLARAQPHNGGPGEPPPVVVPAGPLRADILVRLGDAATITPTFAPRGNRL